MKSLHFKFHNSLDLRKPIKERTSIIIRLEFVRFISTQPRYWKALFRSEPEKELSGFSVKPDSRLIPSTTLVMKWFPNSLHWVKCVQIRSFVWSVFSRIRTEYGEILCISIFSPNAGKYRQEEPPYLDTFMQCYLL